MPQANDELRDKMGKYYGDRIDCGAPLKYLLDRGFTDDAGWIKPPTISYALNDQEFESVTFLIDEWDFAWGGLPAPPP